MKIFKILFFVLAFALASVAGASVDNGVYISAQTAQTKATAAQAAAIAAGFASGQSYNCATGHTINGGTYTNATGKSIFVIASGTKLDNSIEYLVGYVAGTVVNYGTWQNITGWISGIELIVPSGATFAINSANGTRSTTQWCELK